MLHMESAIQKPFLPNWKQLNKYKYSGRERIKMVPDSLEKKLCVMGMFFPTKHAREGGEAWKLLNFLVHDQVIVALSSFNFWFLEITPLVWQSLRFLCPISFEIICLFVFKSIWKEI